MSDMTGPALLSLAIRPRTHEDLERLGHGIRTLIVEDPTLSAAINGATGDVVIAGMGELQLEIVIDRLKREFNVEASVGPSLVAYKEMLTQEGEGEGRFAPHTRAQGEYAHVKIRLYPGAPGSGYHFSNEIGGSTIQADFVQAIDDGIQETLACGVLAGYPIDDVRVVLYDATDHDGNSPALTFKIAGSMALADAAKKAKPILIEPVMRVEVMAPVDCGGDVGGDLSSRRGWIESIDERDRTTRVDARAPLATMLGYAADLRSRTRGRATFAMQFAGYRPCDPAEGQETADDSMVPVPRRPLPTLLDSSVVLHEPTDDGRQD